MDKYIYFAAELPMLKWSEAPFISLSAFLEEARKWLSESDFRRLIHAVLFHYDLQKFAGIYGKYLCFEHALRQELAAYRKSRKEGFEHRFRDIPPQLVREGNPLDVEKNLLRYRWNWLEDQEFGHYSDPDFFILYYLKLQILHQLAVYEEEAGRKAFRALVEQSQKTNRENAEKSA